MSFPAIVLIESLPYLPTYIPFYKDYSQIYSKIARHYSIPIWSIRDAVNSNYAAANQSEYVSYMKHDEAVRYDLHPGWHVHLLWADMIAGLIKRMHHTCVKDRSWVTGSRTLHVPPPVLQNSTRSCSLQSPYLLDISAAKLMNKESIIGNWTVSPQLDHMWELRSEGRGRVGWIQEMVPELVSYNGTATITFYPDDPGKTLGFDGGKPHIIQIQYMRTYKNAGQVRIWVCGNLIVQGDGMIKRDDKLDALWGSFDTYKYSLPEIEYIIFPDFGIHCRDPNDMGIRFEYVKEISCMEKKIRRHNRDITEDECRKEAEARTKLQKFKLISVKVCSLSS